MNFVMKFFLMFFAFFSQSMAFSNSQSDIQAMNKVLDLASEDAESLILTGTVCEEVGVSSSQRRIQCGLLGIRQIDGRDFWTTRCYLLCLNGYFEQGNFCQIEAVATPNAEDMYCDR